MESKVFNEDCMIGMARYPDKYFDLAVVDPPYGISINMNMGRKKGQEKRHDEKKWDDCIPDKEYFNELFRISKEQIIWGGNYFMLPLTGGWLFWDKEKGKETTFSDGELAWTSFLNTLKKASIRYDGFIGRDTERIHPTQKPVALYDWIYKNYLPNGGKVIDTHLGSASNRISAYKRGNIDFYGWEIDSDYFRDGDKRFNDFVKNYAPSEIEPINATGQIKLL